MAKGLAVGLNKGYVVSKIEVPSKRLNKNRNNFINVSQKESSINQKSYL